MKKIIVYGLVLFLLACEQTNQQTMIPDSVLSKEKMADIIMQIHLAEARANLSSEPSISLTAKVDIQELIKNNNLSPEQYDSSMVFYLNHPELLNEIYEITLSELTRKQSEAGKK